MTTAQRPNRAPDVIARPTKPFDEMSEAEIDAFASDFYDALAAAKPGDSEATEKSA